VAENSPVSPSLVYRFGVFQANLAARELRKHGVRVRLQGQPFCILSIFLERPGEIVTREEMQQKLWTTDTFVDFEHSLNSAIKKLRAALGDTSENSRYIETLPRVGYRFVAPVEEIAADGSLPTEASGGDEGTGATAAAERTFNPRWPIAIGLVAGFIAAVGLYIHWSRDWPRTPPATGRTLLAVLPFENLPAMQARTISATGSRRK
jgi:DNA-binding winged helix-turn-helix (wHTH) protein